MSAAPTSRRVLGGGLAPALAAGGALALLAAPWGIPLAGPLLTLFAPLPLVLAYSLRGARAGRLALLLAAGATFLLMQVAQPLAGSYYLVYFFALSLVLGEALCRGLREDWAVAGAAGAGMLAVFILLLIGSLVLGRGPWQLWQDQWQNELTVVLQMYRGTGLDEAAMNQLRQTLEQIGRLVLRLAPGILATASLLVAWVNLLLVRRLGRRARPQPAGGDLTQFRAPERLVWVLIAAGAVMVFAQGWLFWAGANLVLALGTVYFFQGMAVLAYWLKKKNAPALLRVSIYVLVVMEFFLAVIIAAAGLFDIWFNLRRQGQEPAA
ncbi:MAG: DUF2232 domain-containing protein [Desulfarculus sp.]|nr:MAG: DUF2232 domain-containing protein [Desulfarculus sp.]